MKAKKSLGQNFLKSKGAIKAMVTSAQISSDDFVLEVGPGKGVLTEELLAKAKRVVAVEFDQELVGYLSDKFAQQIKEGSLEIVFGDILEFDPKKYFNKKFGYKIVANIPYYITGAIFKKFLSNVFQPKSMTVLVQKEVAERIVARAGKESILSLSVKVFGEPKYIEKVPARYFSPEPKVDSAIIHIANISMKRLGKMNPENFFEIVKIAFSQKRKTLLKNLGHYFNKEELQVFLEKNGLNPMSRAEDLSLENFISLAKSLFPQKKANK